MNCVSHQPAKPASGPSQVVVTISASETVLLSGTVEDPDVSELVFQEEMNRRAEVITDVLAGIMEQPAAFRHWGLNE
jgi:hypothetical protein